MEERFLLFTAAGERFALRLQEVGEVMEPQPYFPLPRAPRHFLGLLNIHGTLTALVDMARYLGRERPTRRGKVLVLDQRSAHLALLVDGVISIMPFEGVSAFSPCEEPAAEALLETELGRFRLLSEEALVAALEEGL